VNNMAFAMKVVQTVEHHFDDNFQDFRRHGLCSESGLYESQRLG
jgi:hypothetical protein